MCRSRVKLLRELNPDVPIYGLFGGSGGAKGLAFRVGSKVVVGLNDFYASGRDERWSWKNGDLVLAAWYRDVGRRIDFDVVHFVEWDLLLLDALDSLYASVPKDALGLTAVVPVSATERTWHWLRDDEGRREWTELLAYARGTWGYDDVPHACLGGGSCFPRSFLEKYAALSPPELCHDELRVPLFAQILGFSMLDTGLRGPWRGEREDRLFNLEGREIEPDAIRAELAKPDGRRAFHPVRSRFRLARSGIERS